MESKWLLFRLKLRLVACLLLLLLYLEEFERSTEYLDNGLVIELPPNNIEGDKCLYSTLIIDTGELIERVKVGLCKDTCYTNIYEVTCLYGIKLFQKNE